MIFLLAPPPPPLPLHVAKKDTPINSATGTLFKGARVRTFRGGRLLRSNRQYPAFDVNLSAYRAHHCKRWAVVTTIFDPTEAVARVAKSPSWCLAIVPDLKTPSNYMAKLSTFVNTSNAFYLSVEKQRDNGSPIELLPPGKDVTKMKLPNTSIVMQGAYAFNHHPVMGASVPNSWPRGFPLSLIKNNATQGADAFEMDLPFATRDQEIGVIQYLADGDPDIDAIHRMTRTLPMYFEGDKSVLTPMHSYSPYNAQATVHSKNALWAMLLPSTVPGRVSDIWRSYFAQCIFADAGLRLVFSPSIVTQERNDHDYRKDFNAEHDLYEKAEKLIEYLREWDSSDDTVPARMESLWIDLYECGYIEIEDVFSVQLWLQALAQVGYDFPSLKRRHRNVVLMGQFNYADSESTVDDVIFWTQKH
ncbi:hypothetical protein ACHAXT_003803, partial [Thalassiosira profunda]